MTAPKPPQALERCPSAYAADRAALFSTGDEARAHLDQCPACRERYETDAAYTRHFETELFPQTVDTVTRRIFKEQQTSAAPSSLSLFRKKSLWVGIGLAAAAVLALILVVPSLQSSNSPAAFSPLSDPGYLGDKGTVGLEIYCKRGDAVFRVHQGMTLRAEDQLRFVPVLPENTPLYVMVVSVDSRATVSRYFPTETERAVRIDTSNAPLPGAVILDAAPGAEQIWLFSSETPFDFEPIRDAIARERQKSEAPERIERIPTTIDQTGIVFRKGER